MVGLDHPLRIGDRAAAVGASSWIMWPRKEGISPSPTVSVGDGARLGELAGDPPDLHDRQRRAVGEHGRHLQEDLQPLADRGSARRSRGTTRRSRPPGAGTPGRRRPRPGPSLELARLAGEDERRHGGELFARSLGALLARPLRLVERGIRAPGRRRPDGSCDSHLEVSLVRPLQAIPAITSGDCKTLPGSSRSPAITDTQAPCVLALKRLSCAGGGAESPAEALP